MEVKNISGYKSNEFLTILLEAVYMNFLFGAKFSQCHSFKPPEMNSYNGFIELCFAKLSTHQKMTSIIAFALLFLPFYLFLLEFLAEALFLSVDPYMRFVDFVSHLPCDKMYRLL